MKHLIRGDKDISSLHILILLNAWFTGFSVKGIHRNICACVYIHIWNRKLE